MTEFVRRPARDELVRTTVSGGRPVPMGDDHHGRATDDRPGDDGWSIKLAAIVAEAVARREDRRAQRAEFTARRVAGKAARHARRLRESS